MERDVLAALDCAVGDEVSGEVLLALVNGVRSVEQAYRERDLSALVRAAGGALEERERAGRRVFVVVGPRSGCGEADPGRAVSVVDALLGLVPLDGDGRRSWQGVDLYLRDHLATHAAAAGRLAELAGDAGFLAFADPDRLARVLHRVDRSRSPLLRAYWRALHRLRAAAPADRSAVLQAMVHCEEPEALDAPRVSELADAAGWAPAWAGERGRTAFHRRLLGHGDDPTRDEVPLDALAFGTIGDRTVLASGGRDGETRLWDARTGELLSTLGTPLRSASVLLEFGIVDGRPVLVGGSRDGTVRIWDPLTGVSPAVFSVPAGHARAAAFVPLDDGRWALAVASGFEADDGSGRPSDAYAHDAGGVDLWDPFTGARLAQLLACDEVVLGVVALTVAGRSAVAALCGDAVRVWDATTRELLAQWSDRQVDFDVPPFVGPLATVDWKGREVLALVAEEEGTGWDNREWQQSVFLWDPSAGPTGRLVKRFGLGESESVLAFGRTGFASTGGEGGDGGEGGEISRETARETVLATVSPRSDGAWSDDVGVWVRTLDGRAVTGVAAHTGHFLTGAFGTVGGTTVLATTRTGGFDRTPQGGHDIVLLDVPAAARYAGTGERDAGGLALGTDGRQPVLLVGGTYEVDVRDPVTGRSLARTSPAFCDNHKHGQSRGVAVASGVVDGSPLLAVAGIGHGVSLCDPATGAVVRELRGHPTSWSRFVAFGDTGRRVLLPGRPAAAAKRVALLAEADTSGPVTVWDAATGEVIGTVDAYGRLTALGFATVAGRTVLATVHGESLTLWDPVKVRALRNFPCGAAGLALGTVAGHDVHATASGRRVLIRDSAGGQLLSTVENLGAAVTCLSLATMGDRDLLVTGDSSGAVRMWDAVTGDHLTTLATFARVVHEVVLAAVGDETYVFAQSRAGRLTACRVHAIGEAGG
ncbi:WD40 repeat domain-containing protein [Streptomyces sp. NPDC002499]